MNNEMHNVIVERSKNLGQLSAFLLTHKDYMDYINNSIPIEICDRGVGEKVWYYLNGEKNLQLCSCGKHKNYISFKKGYRMTCGDNKCHMALRKETNLKKYGVDNPRKNKEVIEKAKKTVLEKYNGKHYMYDDNVRAKYKNTMLNKYGVEWSQQDININKKSKESWKKNDNKENILSNRAEAYKKTYIENKEEIDSKRNIHHDNKLKMELPTNIELVSRKRGNNSNDKTIFNLKCKLCNNNFEISREYLSNRLENNSNPCIYCLPKGSIKSYKEIELFNFIKEYYPTVISSDKTKLENLELDIFLPEINMAFEFNGLYWHNELYKDRNYHLKKTLLCKEAGIDLIHIWEDDWDIKQDIVKSIILNKIGKTPTKIYARKCEIREVTDTKSVKEFLVKNHIQGHVGSSHKIGLFYNNELVSLMTFGSLRKSLGQKSTKDVYELLRFCNKINTSVIGGSSRLLKYFINKYDPETIMSYNDVSRSNGNMYEVLGFQKISDSKPGYYYVINNIREHRFKYRKDVLISEGYDSNMTEHDIMLSRNIYRIYDCGVTRWELKLRN